MVRQQRRRRAPSILIVSCSAATNNQTGEGVAIKKVTNVFSKKILAKRALREIKLLQHFRGMSTTPTPGNHADALQDIAM
jgi:hypothetical protein